MRVFVVFGFVIISALSTVTLSVGHQTGDLHVGGSSPRWTLPRSGLANWALGKLLRPVCLCHQAVKFNTGQEAVMPSAWKKLVVVVCLFRREKTTHYTHYTKITITKACNQKGNAHHAGHLWHKQKNNYLTIC